MHKVIDSLNKLFKTLSTANLQPNTLIALALFVVLVAIWVLGRR